MFVYSNPKILSLFIYSLSSDLKTEAKKLFPCSSLDLPARINGFPLSLEPERKEATREHLNPRLKQKQENLRERN